MPRKSPGRARPKPAGALPPHDVFVIDRAGLRRIDELTRDEYGIPTIVLMENAAGHLAGAVIDVLEGAAHDTVVVVAGPGNNGGDGLALARHLHNAEVPVAVAFHGDPARASADTAVHLRATQKMGIDVRPVDAAHPERTLDTLSTRLGGIGVIVDALFGTGCERAIVGPAAALISVVNATRRLGVRVVAVDLPSGLDCDSGRGWGPEADPAVRAVLTVSFAGLKPGFASLDAQSFLGDVLVADIGAPRELVRRFGRPLGSGGYPGDPAKGARPRGPGGEKPNRPSRR